MSFFCGKTVNFIEIWPYLKQRDRRKTIRLNKRILFQERPSECRQLAIYLLIVTGNLAVCYGCIVKV